MHVTLSRRFNVTVTALWALLLAAMLLTTTPFPAIELAVGMLLGMTAGHFQNRALSATPAAFLATQTAMSVRRTLFASSAGKASIILLWVNSVGLLIWAMAFAPDMFVGAWLGGVACFGLAREVVAFRGVVRLANLGK